MARITRRWPVLRLDQEGERRRRVDQLAGEEPLEIQLDGSSFSVTMRTPGADVELVAGFLVSEGVIWRPDHVHQMEYSGVTPQGQRDYNVLNVRSEEHTSELQSRGHLVCRLLLGKKKRQYH